MKKALPISIFLAAIILSASLFAQNFDSEWHCLYATYDASNNGTGYNTISVGAIADNEFVALVNRANQGSYYLVGYRDADSANGRLGQYPYSEPGFAQLWQSGFDQVAIEDSKDISVGADDRIYVANNDPGRNILTFTLGQDSVLSDVYRLPTGADYLYGIDVDDQGRVFVTSVNTDNNTSKVLVFDNVTNEGAWTDPVFTTATVMQTIDLPGEGEARGITVNSDGSVIWVSVWHSKKVYCYTGTPETGYTLDTGFNFELDDTYYVEEGGIVTDTVYTGPWGLQYMEQNNILFMCADADYKLGNAYHYAKIFLMNPQDATLLDTVNVAWWNYITLDSSYTNRSGGTDPGNASGYASTYYVDVDDNGNLYSQSFYGWAAEKWQYQGTLPVVTSLRQTSSLIPEKFELNQNFPNPFNPSTTISFSISERAVITLNVYSVTGELVASLVSGEEFEAGTYETTLDASNLASGIYLYSLTTGDVKLTKKMTLLK